MRTPALFIVSFLLVASGPANAQTKNSEHTLKLDQGAEPLSADLSELAWLAGYWRGSGLGGATEEFWTEPTSGIMLGAFSLIKDGELAFSEAIYVLQGEQGIEMRIKHFTAEFVGWEEKEDYVTFPLVKLEENAAYFNGLTYLRKGDTLEVYLVLVQGGKRTEHSFSFERVAI